MNIFIPSVEKSRPYADVSCAIIENESTKITPKASLNAKPLETITNNKNKMNLTKYENDDFLIKHVSD